MEVRTLHTFFSLYNSRVHSPEPETTAPRQVTDARLNTGATTVTPVGTVPYTALTAPLSSAGAGSTLLVEDDALAT